jgi:hypothetical protein
MVRRSWIVYVCGKKVGRPEMDLASASASASSDACVSDRMDKELLS